MHHINLQPAYVLHSRPYRETSLLVDLITPEYGCLRVVVRGANNTKSGLRNRLQPFRHVIVSWYGKGELKTLKTVEETAVIHSLKGNALFSGLYLNELLLRLISGQDDCNNIFNLYANILAAMACIKDIQPLLRIFELQLLEQLGYAIPFPEKCLQRSSDEQANVYHYQVEGVFSVVQGTIKAKNIRYFSHYDLTAISQGDYSKQQTLQAAKRLMRLAIAPLLGNKELKSRTLFIKQLRHNQ